MPFSFSFCILKLYFVFYFSELTGFEAVTSVYPTGTKVFLIFLFFFQILLYSRSPNKQVDDFKWGAKEMQSALWATCIEQEHMFYPVDSQI